VVLATDANDNSIICLDSKGPSSLGLSSGHPNSSCSDYAIDRTGLVYLVEDQKARIIGKWLGWTPTPGNLSS